MNRKKIFSILFIVILGAAIPLAVFLSQQQQELRQHAGTEGVTFSLAPDTLPVSAEPTATAILNMVDSTNSKINSYDITLISSSDNIVFTDFTDIPNDFEKLVSTVEDSGKKLRVIVINQHGTFLTGTRLGIVHMQKNGVGTATISLDTTKTIITAKGSDSSVIATNLGQTLATYTITDVVPTSTSSSPTVAPTAAPTSVTTTAPSSTGVALTIGSAKVAPSGSVVVSWQYQGISSRTEDHIQIDAKLEDVLTADELAKWRSPEGQSYSDIKTKVTTFSNETNKLAYYAKDCEYNYNQTNGKVLPPVAGSCTFVMPSLPGKYRFSYDAVSGRSYSDYITVGN